MNKPAFLPAGEEAKEKKPPVMHRSRNQLASSYAPGAFFTFEGGRGACIAEPDKIGDPDKAAISDATRDQIIQRLAEVWQSWFSRAMQADYRAHPLNPKLCIDKRLLGDDGRLYPLGAANLCFVNPKHMGYVPAPLTFVCNHCGLFKSYPSVSKLAADAQSFKRLPCRARRGKGGNEFCQWRQLDVVFVHWSGEWSPATPGRWEWDETRQEPQLHARNCNLCHGDSFLLHTQSPRIGEWYFQCANPACSGRRGPWRVNDRFTTGVLRQESNNLVGERRMEPISYRASAAYYAQSEQFVVFSERDQGLLQLLQEGKQRDLGNFIASKYGFEGAPPTVDEMKEMLLQGGHDQEWKTYSRLERTSKALRAQGDADSAAELEDELQVTVNRWTRSDPPLVTVQSELPPGLRNQIASRADFSSRYDPFSLAVEHEALRLSKLSRPPDNSGRAPFVRFHRLDADLAPKNEAVKVAQQAKTVELMQRLGWAEAGLIRDFELCRFTHGYTRMSAVPLLDKHNSQMPVRLQMFEPLASGQRPIYVVTQANEAIYVQLKPEMVQAWLNAVGMENPLSWTPGDKVSLGGRVLEAAEPFGRYFSNLKEGPAAPYRYVYTLLHSYAHLLMKAIAEFSGLDVGSLGEYLFPADLAFVVYRNGTTMDLGNLSSLWRNHDNIFLRHLLEPMTHRCASGSLCDSKGSACPDCILVPETSCIAQNRLLSRSVLAGGSATTEDLTHRGQRIPGYLEVVHEQLAGHGLGE